MNRPVVIVCFYDFGCANGARSLCATLNHSGFPAKLLHFGYPSPFRDPGSVRLLQCRGFLNLSEIIDPGDSEFDDCIDLIAGLDPLLVGLSLDSRMTPFAKRLTERLRVRCPDLPLVWGGIHAIIDPEHCLRFVDTVCVGEGEEAIVEMARRVRDGNRDFRGIPNLMGVTPSGERYANARVILPDLSAYPPPFLDPGDHLWIPRDAFDRLIRLSRSDGGHLIRAHAAMASRGCRYKCAYCYADTVRRQFGVDADAFVRTRSVDHLFRELRQVKTLPHINFIWFWDDNFGLDLKWLGEFAERYPREIGLPFSGFISPYTATEERVRLLKKAGCHAVGVGFQSGSERIQRGLYGRPFSREDVLRAAHLLHPQIPTFYDLIVDNPYETEDDLRATIDLLLEMPLPFGIATNTLLWYPNASLTLRALADGVITNDDIVGYRTDGEYAYRDVTFREREPGDDSRARRRYGLKLLAVATQHPILPRETIREWSRDDELLDDPDELERRLLRQYVVENENDVLSLEDRVVELQVEIAGLRARLDDRKV